MVIEIKRHLLEGLLLASFAFPSFVKAQDMRNSGKEVMQTIQEFRNNQGDLNHFLDFIPEYGWPSVQDKGESYSKIREDITKFAPDEIKKSHEKMKKELSDISDIKDIKWYRDEMAFLELENGTRNLFVKENGKWKWDFAYGSVVLLKNKTNTSLDAMAHLLKEYKKEDGGYPRLLYFIDKKRKVKDLLSGDRLIDYNEPDLFGKKGNGHDKYLKYIALNKDGSYAGSTDASDYILYSNGPDCKDNSALEIYDPKNGLISDGDIIRYSNEEVYRKYVACKGSK